MDGSLNLGPPPPASLAHTLVCEKVNAAIFDAVKRIKPFVPMYIVLFTYASCTVLL